MARRRADDLAETRRREILDAAARCFVRRGVHQTSMREIIAEAGLSAGAIYNYFDGKEAIIEAIAARERRVIEEFADYLETEPDPRTAIIEAVREIIRDCPPDEARLGVELLAEGSRNPAVLALLKRNDAALREAFLSAIRRGQESGQIASGLGAEPLLDTIVALYEGFIGHIALDPEADRAAYARAAVAALTALLAGPTAAA